MKDIEAIKETYGATFHGGNGLDNHGLGLLAVYDEGWEDGYRRASAENVRDVAAPVEASQGSES